MICTLLHLYLNINKGVSTPYDTPYRRVPSEKNTGMVANTVANAIAVLLTYKLPTMLEHFMTQFPVILLNDLFFPSPNDVIWPRPLRPSSSCGTAQDVEKISILLRFWTNDPLRGNFQNSVPKAFIATPIEVLCSNFVKFSRQKIGKVVRCLPDKNVCLALQLSLLLRSRPKSARASSLECTVLPNFTEIGSRLVQLYPNAWTPSKRAVVFPIFGWCLASSRIKV